MGMIGNVAAESRIAELEGRVAELHAKVFLSISELLDACALEDEIQSLLSVKDYRHKKMFAYADGNSQLLLYWGGYEYCYEMARFVRPEDLMWLVVHLSEKDWTHMTGERVGLLIKSVARIKGWPAYKHSLHPNEAPKPNHAKIAEREKMKNAIRYEVIKRDSYRCRCCGFAVQDGAHLHVDHIVAVANGGRTELQNLQTLCTVCNLGKGAK